MTPDEQQALAESIPLARQLLASGDREGAVALLDLHLSKLHPELAPDDRVLLEAAALHSALTGDLRWLHYSIRAGRNMPRPRPRPLSPRHGEPGITGHSGDLAPEPDRRRLLDNAAVADTNSPMQVLSDAQTLHAQGRCGEAIRTATQAVNLWRRQFHSAEEANGGATLLMWLVAMLCACRRDDDAEARLLADELLLPEPGTAERGEFAVYGIRVLTRACTTHDDICARGQLPPSLAELGAPATTGAAARPWHERRDRWWLLLLTGAP
jgi:hypothetical protein